MYSPFDHQGCHMLFLGLLPSHVQLAVLVLWHPPGAPLAPTSAAMDSPEGTVPFPLRFPTVCSPLLTDNSQLWSCPFLQELLWGNVDPCLLCLRIPKSDLRAIIPGSKGEIDGKMEGWMKR